MEMMMEREAPRVAVSVPSRDTGLRLQQHEQWTRRYQRNNKQDGLKNLRCFPFCSTPHRVRGFCGHPVRVRLALARFQELRDSGGGGVNVRCFAAFQRIEGRLRDSGTLSTTTATSATNGAERCNIVVGEVVPEGTVQALKRTREMPFNQLMEAELDEEENDEGHLTFVVNRQRKGWHYGWVSNKHTCNEWHVLRFFVCVNVVLPTLGSAVKCIASIDSPSFTVFCRRRQRDHVQDLPPQLGTLAHLQLRKKEFQHLVEQNPQYVQALKESETAVQARITPSEGTNKRSHHSEENLASQNKSHKKKRNSNDNSKRKDNQDQEDDASSFEQIHDSGSGSGSNSPLPLISPVATPPANHFSPSGPAENDFFLSLTGDLFIDGNAFFLDEFLGSDFPAKESVSSTSSPFTQVIPPTPSEETMILRVMSALSQLGNASSSDMNSKDESGDLQLQLQQSSSNDLEELSKSITECLDSMFGEQQTQVSRSPLQNIFSKSNSIFSKREDNKSLDKILQNLALYLIGETDFSDEINRVLRSTWNEKEAEDVAAKRAFFSVIVKQINTFLNRYSLTLADLDKLILAQTRERDADSKEGFKEGGSKIEDQVKKYRLGPQRLVFSSTVSSPASVEKDARGSEKTLNTSSRKTIMDILLHAVNDTLGLDQKPTVNIPALTPAMDLSGGWRRPEATLKALERLREKVGTPWFLRKLLKEMEATFEIECDNKGMKVLYRRKLLSSGHQTLLFDGQLHPANMLSPIPGEDSLSKLSACAWLDPVHDCVIISQVYTESLRILRATRKNVELNEIQSVVAIQSKSNSMWQNQVIANVRAVPQTLDVVQGDEEENGVVAT